MKRTPYANEWFHRADEDIQIAKLLSKEGGPPNGICFHAQQAAEKYLKGFLAMGEENVRKVHRLDELVLQCKKIDPSFHSLLDQAIFLNEFYVETRYPGDIPEFGIKTAKKALEAAVTIRDHVLSIVTN